MLALNTYGLATATCSSTASIGTNERVVLPRLSEPGRLPVVREICSLPKLKIVTRASGHPFYRTTSTYDYGRYVDFYNVALTCPKHSRPAGFTKEFIAGNYADNSLLSLDNRKKRADHWQEKMAMRSSQMRLKHAEMQHMLLEKKEVRRVDREKRRLEMALFRAAVVQIQARMRGYLTRTSLALKKLECYTEAALCIQRANRVRARVCAAKKVLKARRREKLEKCAIKMQRTYRNYCMRQRATQQLLKLQEAKRQRALDLEYKAQCLCNSAATQIQCVARGYFTRKVLHRQTISASSMEAEKDSKDLSQYGNGRGRSRGARRMITPMQQVRRRTTVRIACILLK